jgi:ribosomal protein S27AE
MKQISLREGVTKMKRKNEVKQCPTCGAFMTGEDDEFIVCGVCGTKLFKPLLIGRKIISSRADRPQQKPYVYA